MSTPTSRKSAPKAAYRCAECGWTTTKWVGRCGECQAWGTVEDAAAVPVRTTVAGPVTTAALPILEVDAQLAQARPTGVSEFDRVLGGGLVPGVVVLVAGEPGIGKSTLLLDVCGREGRAGRRVLYVTGEESAAQVRLRGERIEALARTLYLAAETDLAAVLGHIDQVQPDLLVIDSVQTIGSAQVDGAAGNVAQVREVAAALIAVAKARGIATLLVGHVTKDGSIAGPRVLEHLVDVVIQFEGERHSRLRLVRAVKNRYGPTDEVGCFDLSDVGITGLADPSGLFLSSGGADAHEQVPGTCVTVTLEGRRPLLAEVQALVAPSVLPSPRRATSGLDGSRVSMLMAVLERRARVTLRNADIYVSTVGGVRVSEPATDLAVALAVAGAANDRALVPRTVAFGEVGLAGEIRPVSGVPRRLSEAARLGFTAAIVPPGSAGNGALPDGLRIIEVPDLATAVRLAMTRSV
ncbi:DNA repair protein RadA [Angustibacter sp. McL0619]|uniref:DNA repair protein RadA n=1 Tax=Angustibacter sp. McL0619 TaxID=3415676 RepID=UPI003CFAA9CD